MKVEVITIGDEILSGAITDTNFAWLGDLLWSRGYELHWHTSVGDEAGEIDQALRAAVGRSQAVIVTGGLGPTIDDITVETAAKTFGVSWILDSAVLDQIRAWFTKRGREMAPKNEKQAYFPQGATVIPNNEGTAPGCYFVFQNTHYFFLPGVPREMKRMVEEWVIPQLEKVDTEKKKFASRFLRTFGLPESGLAEKLDDMDLKGVDLAYRVSFPEIFLKVSAFGPDASDLEVRVSQVTDEIYRRLGNVVYGEGRETFPAIVGKLLKDRNESLSVAESCTGGRLASLITDIPGSSNYFDRGVVTYSNQSKMELLGVPEKTLKDHGAVSSETAIAMAQGMRRAAKTTYSLAITGIAGPDGGTPEKPVGTVHIALDGPKGTTERKLFFATNREWFKHLVAFAALDLLRKKLLHS